MRANALNAAPFAQDSFWSDPADIFRVGGDRRWADLIEGAVLDRFGDRLKLLDPDQQEWALRGFSPAAR